jgi:hypothetical protein
MARVASLLSLFGVAAAAPAMLIQTDGVSDSVLTQVKVVQKIIAQLQKDHRQVTSGEKETLDMVDNILETVTLVNIDNAHKADNKLLADAVETIRACDDDLKERAEIDAAKATSDAAKAALAQCRAKEAELLAFQQGEQKKLENFVGATSQGPARDGVSGLECAMPNPSQLDDTPDGMGDFFKSSESWYSSKLDTLNTLDDNNKKAIAAHAAQKADCDNNYQPDWEAKYCAWVALVTNKRTAYGECRTSTMSALDTTFDDVTVKSGHRKADFAAVNRVRCLLKVLSLEGAADDVDAELNKCLDEVIEVSQFTIAKPEYPASDTEGLAALGNIAEDAVKC